MCHSVYTLLCQLEKLDKHLETSTTRFASEIAENKRARAEINELRRERRRFKQVLSSYTNRYQEVEKEIHRIVAESQTWLQERSEYVDRIEDLKRVADTGQEEFLAQCRELKQVMRAFDSMEERLSKGEFEIPNHMGSMTAEQEEDLQKKVVKGKWQLAKEKAMTDLLKEQALSFEEAFEKLQVTSFVCGPAVFCLRPCRLLSAAVPAAVCRHSVAALCALTSVGDLS